MKPLPLCRIYQYMNNMTYHHLSVLVHRQAEKYGDKVALKYRDYENVAVDTHHLESILTNSTTSCECYS